MENIVELFKGLGLKVWENLKRSFRKVEKEIWRDYFKNGKAFDETFLKVIIKVEVRLFVKIGLRLWGNGYEVVKDIVRIFANLV